MDTAENQGLENKALGEQGLQDKSSDGKDAEESGQQDQPAPEPSATTTEEDDEDAAGEPGGVSGPGPSGEALLEEMLAGDVSITSAVFPEPTAPQEAIAEAVEEEGLAEAQESHDTDSDAAHDAALRSPVRRDDAGRSGEGRDRRQRDALKARSSGIV